MLEIANLTTAKIDQIWLKEIADKILKILDLKDASISLVLVGADRIRQLNKKWRGRNKVTDVLAFANREQKGKSKFITPKDFENFLGEVFICLPQAKKQAKQVGHSLKNELTLLLAHGILHLVGYEDEGTEKERKEMRGMEGKIVKGLIELT